jgi:hypothetical protein
LNVLITINSYLQLDEGGKVDLLAKTHDLAEAQITTENEIAVAIKELRSTTDAINRQTETLQFERQCFERLIQKRSDSASHRLDFENECARKAEIDRKTIGGEVCRTSP